MRESDVQKAIIQYLEVKHIFHYRNNSGAYKAEHGSFIRYGAVGSPDIICVINGQYVGIEVKRPGGRLSPFQKIFAENLVKAGGRYILAFSIDDVIANL